MSQPQRKRFDGSDTELLRLLVENVIDYAIFLLDAKGHVASWNQGAERINGYQSEEIIGQHFSKFYPQEALDRGWPAYELEVASQVGRFEDEGWRVRKDGSQFWANVVITALNDDEGNLLGFSKITRDLTTRKQAEENARRLAEESAARRLAHDERERLRVTLASIGDGVISTDAQGHIDFLNSVAEQMVGWRSEEAAGKPLSEVFRVVHEHSRQPVEDPALRALQERKIVGLANHAILIAKDETERPIEDSAAPICNEQGEVTGSVLVFRDVTTERRAERQRNTRMAVTSVLGEAANVDEAARGLLRAVGENMGWEVGYFWLVDHENQSLTCACGWHRSDYNVDDFERVSCSRSFAAGEGLPGRTWEAGQPLWMVDVTKDSRFPRAAAAVLCGLHSAFACTVKAGGGTIGVIEFFTKHIREPDAEFLEMMGTIAGGFGQFIQRTEAENELRESEQELADFFENATVGLHFVGLDGTIVRANRAELEMLGYSREEYVGRPIADFHMDTTAIEDILHRLRSGEEVHEYPAKLICKNGAVKDVLIDSSALFRDGRFVHSRCFTRDVTERLRSEAALREVQRRFEAVFNQQFQFMAILTPEGRVLEANETCFASTGVKREQVIGKEFWNAPWWDHLAHIQIQWKSHIASAAAGQGPITGEIEYRTANGANRHATSVVTGLKDEFGRITSLMIEGHDDTESRQAEVALRESQEKWRLLADTIPQLAWMAQPDGYIFWYNRRWYEYTGTTPEQMEGWGWQSVHDPTVLPQVVERWKHSLATGDPFDMVFPLRGADNILRPFLTRVNPLRDDDGKLLYWFGTNTDITELRQARAALFDSEERLRLALDAGRMGVWDWNVLTGDLQWSDSLEPLHGLQVGTFGGTFEHFQQLIHPEDRQLVNDAIQNALATGGEFYVEFRNLRSNGGVHWIAGSGKVFFGPEGNPVRMIGVGMDVTPRKRAEQTARFLADASAALAVLVDFDSTLQKVASLAVPYFADWAAVDVFEPDGALRRVAVAHIDPAKVQLAHEIHRRFPPDPSSPNGVWNILRTGQAEIVPEITEEMLQASIKEMSLLQIMRELGLKSYIGVPLTVRGKTIGVLTFIVAESGYVYDDTDLAVAKDLANRAAIAVENTQLYRELKDADGRKDEFLAMLAHELRNPLAPIRNGLQILRMSGKGGEWEEETRHMMERQLGHMVRLVDDLLDVSRITRNKLELRKERVTLATVIQTAIETSRPMFEQFGHTFSLTLSPIPIYLLADPVRLAQSFSNLLNNAAKYTSPGGRITLTAELQKAEAVVRVRDNGLGIPVEAQQRIFEMFSQVDRNMERAQGGLGIGLALVRRLIEMHGGTVEVESDGPGTGSQFTVRIPVLIENQQHPAIHLTELNAAVGATRRILVVDDNRDAADSLGMMIHLMGFEVRAVYDGFTAIEVAESFLPDLILLDIGLPRLNGYEVCRRIREKPYSKKMLIVALTGWGQDEDRRRSQDAGFDQHLVKPVGAEAIRNLLTAEKR